LLEVPDEVGTSEHAYRALACKYQLAPREIAPDEQEDYEGQKYLPLEVYTETQERQKRLQSWKMFGWSLVCFCVAVVGWASR
jgi:uncharacterized membrane protein YcjF (UPF0283 family)